jgi:hypothetical protein
MSQLDFAQRSSFLVPCESARVSVLFIFEIMHILVTDDIATSLSLSRCCDGARSCSPVYIFSASKKWVPRSQRGRYDSVKKGLKWDQIFGSLLVTV